MLAVAPASATDPARGEQLYQNHCTGCHDSRAHIRDGRKAKDAEDLYQWVSRWRSHLVLDWGRAEVDDVVAYLESRFYKFKSSVTQ